MPTIYDTVTENIIRQIEAGAGSRTMPWHKRGAAAGVPFNASTGKGYQGVNVLLLWGAADAMGYTDCKWATYKQWQALGCQVRKGERATHCVKWKQVEGKRDEDTRADGSKRPLLIPLGFSVFNVAQVDGEQPALPLGDDETVKFSPVERAEQVVQSAGAKLSHGGARAFYRPSTDEIVMPDKFRFTGTATSTAQECYYSTLFHEHVHWTGAEARCKRDLRGRFGDDAYAAEELIAELGAAFICARLGITNEARPDHAQYIDHWLKVLRGDNRAIFTAASRAQAATDFILNRLPAPTALPLAA
jgi:antirestriction protein ArdC